MWRWASDAAPGPGIAVVPFGATIRSELLSIPSVHKSRGAVVAKIRFDDSSRCLHLDLGHRGAPELQHDIHFKVIAIAIVKEIDRVGSPAGLPSKFLQHEGFQQWPESLTFLVK